MTSTICRVTATVFLIFSQQAMSDVWFTQELELSSQGIDNVVIESGAGDLSVSGSSSEQRIRVLAKLNGRELGASDYTLSLNKVGSSAILIAEIKSSWTANNYIDLEVTVPQKLKLDVEDRSGDVLIENIYNDVRVDDRSGDLEIHDIQGSVRIEDNSGDVIVRRVSGSLKLEDKSGDITITQVAGNVDVEDNSGDVVVESTQGNVSVKDSSGDIEIRDTLGTVIIKDSGGDVDINGAEDFTITKSGGGDVTSKNIRSMR